MTGTWLKRVAVLGLCMAVSCRWAISRWEKAPGTTQDIDFAQLYYGARCVIGHKDVYDAGAPLREFEAEGGRFLHWSQGQVEISREVLSNAVYLPTAFLVVGPLALLPYAAAHAVWFWLTAGLLMAAALLMWELAGEYEPRLAGWLAGFMLLNCVEVLSQGNPAGLVVSLCVVAAWCFLRRRLQWLGVAALAVALAIKPHDAGFVWLYFLLAGSAGRKRALQTLAVAAALGVAAVVWIAPGSPHWMQELRSNLAADTAHGGMNDPGMAASVHRGFDPICNLQKTMSVIRDDPRFYDPASYAIGGVLILAWMVAVLRKRRTPEGALLALAAASMLTMLPVYHRTYDAKLVLLAIPACALLWAAGGIRGWVALALTATAIFATSDTPNIFVTVTTASTPLSGASLSGMLKMVALQPVPLVLLAAGCFYLWAYIRFEAPGPGTAERDDVAERQAEPAAS